MKKFYTDPLQAAYMAREFGVEVHGITGKRQYPISNKWEEVINFRCGKMYIRSAYHYIFQPQVGDIIICDHRGEPQWIVEIKADFCKFEAGGGCSLSGVRSIIQRDNKPFFTPTEEV